MKTCHSCLKVFAVCLAICLPRLWLLPPTAVDFDAVDFELALDDYDLSRLSPHFPGYPLYVLAGRLLRPLAGSASYGLLGLLASAGLATCLHGTARDSQSGWAAALLWLALPAVWLESLTAHADLPALLFLAGAWWALEREQPLAAGLAAGVALGFRLSALPLLAVLLGAGTLGRPRGWLHAGLGLGVGLLLWLPWFLVQVGPAEFLAQGQAFSAGHFGDWGQTAFSGVGLVHRPGAFLAGLASASGWNQPWVLAAGLVLLAAVARRGAQLGTLWRLWTLPYSLWLLFGQNLSRGRHYLPLLLAGCWALTQVSADQPAFSARQKWPLRGALLALLLLTTLLSVPRAVRQAYLPAPAAQAARLAAEVERRLGPVLLAGDAVPRYADLHGARMLRRRLRSFGALQTYLAGLWQAPSWVVASSELSGSPPASASLLQRFAQDRGWGSETLSVFLWRPGEP